MTKFSSANRPAQKDSFNVDGITKPIKIKGFPISGFQFVEVRRPDEINWFQPRQYDLLWPNDVLKRELDWLRAVFDPVGGRHRFTLFPVNRFTMDDRLVLVGPPLPERFARNGEKFARGWIGSFDSNPKVTAAHPPRSQRPAELRVEN